MKDPASGTVDVERALAVFAEHGVDASTLTVEELRRARRQIAMKAHPDHGGDGTDMSEVNAAHDILRRRADRRDGSGDTGAAASAKGAGSTSEAKGSSRAQGPERGPSSHARPFERPYTPAPSRRQAAAPRPVAPEWAKAGSGGRFSAVNVAIRRHDFTDRAFLTKWFWENATGARSSFHVQAFSGPLFTGIGVGTSPDLEQRLVAAAADLFRAENGQPAKMVAVHRRDEPSRLWLLPQMRAVALPAALGTPGQPGYAERLQAIAESAAGA